MRRERTARLAVIAAFILLFSGIFYLEIIRGSGFRKLSDKNCVRLMPQEGCRGRITDTRAEVIADNQLCYDLCLMTGNTGSIDPLLKRVDGVLGVGADKLKEAYRNNFVSSSALVCIARNIDLKKAIALEELKAGLNGIVIVPRPQRSYPGEKLAAHILGYINEIDRWRLTKLENYGYKTKDKVGFGGIEEKYDYYLRQEEGGLSIEVDSRGRFVRALGLRPPENGKEINLTIDSRIQRIAQDSLVGKNGAVVIMEPHSGEIVAMASFPDFDPAAFINKDIAYLRRLFTDSESVLTNRAISAVYPAGSVFKLVVAIAALESGEIDDLTTFSCPGKMRIGNAEFGCWDTHHEEKLEDAIAHSCNVYFYRTGLLLGARRIHDWAQKFGFSRITGIDLPYEASGFVPDPVWRRISRLKNWYDGDTLNFSIGQGELLVSPLQVARMTAVFANGGFLVNPYIVKKIDGRGTGSHYKKISSLHLKQANMELIRRGLRSAVVDPQGTAHALNDLTVSVAGKTGSAQAPPGLAHAWFAGYFPYKKPRFVICVFLERGAAGYYATLVAKQIIERMNQENLI